MDIKVIHGAEIGNDYMLLIADTRIFQERNIHPKAYELVEVKELNDREDELKIRLQELNFDR